MARVAGLHVHDFEEEQERAEAEEIEDSSEEQQGQDWRALQIRRLDGRCSVSEARSKVVKTAAEVADEDSGRACFLSVAMTNDHGTLSRIDGLPPGTQRNLGALRELQGIEGADYIVTCESLIKAADWENLAKLVKKLCHGLNLIASYHPRPSDNSTAGYGLLIDAKPGPWGMDSVHVGLLGGSAAPLLGEKAGAQHARWLEYCVRTLHFSPEQRRDIPRRAAGASGRVTARAEVIPALLGSDAELRKLLLRHVEHRLLMAEISRKVHGLPPLEGCLWLLYGPQQQVRRNDGAGRVAATRLKSSTTYQLLRTRIDDEIERKPQRFHIFGGDLNLLLAEELEQGERERGLPGADVGRAFAAWLELRGFRNVGCGIMGNNGIPVPLVPTREAVSKETGGVIGAPSTLDYGFLRTGEPEPGAGGRWDAEVVAAAVCSEKGGSDHAPLLFKIKFMWRAAGEGAAEGGG